MNGERALFLLRGKVKIQAHGYWHTPAGEKGSFGYYPHMKDQYGFPYYPDTEVKGNFRASLIWLSRFSGRIDGRFISDLFGDSVRDDRRERASKIFFSDLSLTFQSKKTWTPSRFEVKTRIAIEEATRTVRKHMLVNTEMAYLEGLELESDVFMGYFQTEDTIWKTMEALDEACQLFPGIGRSRSRGYGRGFPRIEWEEPLIFKFKDDDFQVPEKRMVYVIKALTNVRVKPVNPGSTQKLSTLTHIPSERLRGWFVKTYHMLFGEWPTYEELSRIVFPDLYPAEVGENGEILFGIPSPVTTLEDEEGNIADVAVIRGGREVRENIFPRKTKALPRDYFVTKDKEFRVLRVGTGERIRNKIGENFTSEEQGLYVQEYIRSGTHFWGTIEFDLGEKDVFLSRASYLFSRVNPIVAGSVFSVERFEKSGDLSESKTGLYLVVNPLPFKESLIGGSSWRLIESDGRVVLDSNRLTIFTKRGYRTTINRPKRPIISVRPGSVIYRAENPEELKGLLPWDGFGRKIEGVKKEEPKSAGEPVETKAETGPYDPEKLREEFHDLLSSITSSQIGFLKEFLNPKRNIEEINAVAEGRKEKYQRKNKNQWVKLYSKIMACAEIDRTGEKLRSFIQAFLDAYYMERWEKRKNG